MRWHKHGVIYKPTGEMQWARTHAMLPTPVRHSPETVRVYVTFCDDNGIGRPGFVDLDAKDLSKVTRVSESPLFETGTPGSFDDNGVAVCSVVDVGDGRQLMYYAGFELGRNIRYRILTGLAVSENAGETFTKYSEVPILERSDKERLFRCGPYCIKDNDKFKLWYIAGSSWTTINGKQLPVYDIRYQESANGIQWEREGEIVMPIEHPDEHGFGRPTVISKSDGGYSMFFSVRCRKRMAYRLGYAESVDGKNWERLDDQLNLDISKNGFDNQAIMYAAPIEINGVLYLFYNGNDFGKSGFGLAELQKW